MADSKLEKTYYQTLPGGGRRENVQKTYYQSLPTLNRMQNVQGISSQHGSRDDDRNMKDYKKNLSPIGKMKWSLGEWLAKDQIKLLKEKHQGEIARLNKEHQDEIKGVDQNYQDEIKRLNKKHQDEIDRLEGKLEHQEEQQQNDSKRQDKEIQKLKQTVSVLLKEIAEQRMEWQISQQQRIGCQIGGTEQRMEWQISQQQRIGCQIGGTERLQSLNA